MREPLIKHQIIEYRRNEPFYAANTNARSGENLYVRNSHWHEELELVYSLHGRSRHFIDGEVFLLEPGRLLVTNCESVHRIEVLEDTLADPDVSRTIVLIVHNRFLEENFPEYQDFWFTNDKPQARPEVRDIMLQFSTYAALKEHKEHEHLYMRGLLLQLLYYLYQEGAVRRSDLGSIRRREQVQTLKEILQYVEAHYREPIVQAEVAKEFYFTPQYFARYFKQCTGNTFTEHLTAYRTTQASQELLHTDHRISDVARDNGFHDDRGFINAFKRVYGVTPLQYRKTAAASHR
ncbi:MAG: AraC family transcriptional regulator [Oscillibacter sp.]|nr:AraC family transcriptional regulator [Oscillibacter sp.]